MTGPTNTPFGWSPFTVMPRDDAQGAAELLKEQGIPVITRPVGDEETELLVPTASEDRARDLLEDSDEEQTDEEQTDEEGPEGEDGYEGEDDRDDDNGDATEGSLEDLGDLFDAADRLKHQPWHEGAAAELDQALESMSGASPPYGIGEAFWSRARSMAGDLQKLIQAGAPETGIRGAAEALRDLLRPYI